jgi:hypothetical protein
MLVNGKLKFQGQVAGAGRKKAFVVRRVYDPFS